MSDKTDRDARVKAMTEQNTSGASLTVPPSTLKPSTRLVDCRSCSGVAFHSVKRRLRGDGPVCFGLRRTMLDVSAETIREIHAQSSSDFDKYVGIGYSVSTEAMDRNGFHPVCVMGTQIKIVSIPEEEEEEEEVRPSKANRQHQQHQQQQVEGATATGSFSSEFPQLLWASFGKQSSALYQNWNRTFTNFPQKLYTSSSKLSSSCYRTSIKIRNEVSRIWTSFWK